MLSIDLSRPDLSIRAGHLKMGGVNPQGVEINANSRYLTLGGRPWLPVMGEFHFSRYPADQWETELRKMQAGGVNIVATYLFWIHHEEIEGAFDWSGNRDLRHFVQLCAKVGLYSYPRIGPWAHGEARNGGFPDWLLARCGKQVRRNDPQYLSYVRRWYAQVGAQLQGLLWKEGGPVIGLQLENELTDQPEHIRTLKALAREVGLDVPLYTMTGWGPAQVPQDEVIPVFGGYPDAFWDRQVSDWSRPSRKGYLFSNLRDDNTIGTDLLQMQGTGDLAHLARYPYGTCETGGGMQVAYHRRPAVNTDDIVAIAYCKVGSGSNLLGYYMYHGGSHPLGQRSTLQESQDTAYPNDLPVINYDFQAPLGEYGQARASYHALRQLHLFLNDFGGSLAPLPLTLPDQQPRDLDDRDTLRWSVRSDGARAFLFLNNYQRIESLADHPSVQFKLALKGQTMLLPAQPVHIPSGSYGIWPVNMDLGGVTLRYATAQPICTLSVAGAQVYVFAALPGIAAELMLESATTRSVNGPASLVHDSDGLRLTDLHPGVDCLLRLESMTGQPVMILLLDAAQGRQVYKLHWHGEERVFLSEDNLWLEGETLHARPLRADVSFAVFPVSGRPVIADGRTLVGKPDGVFTRFEASLPRYSIQITLQCIKPATAAPPVRIGPAGVAQAPAEEAWESAAIWQVGIPHDALQGVHDAFLRIDYVGDAARAYVGERFIADDFYFGRPWEIAINRFAPEVLAQGMTLKFLPLRKDAPVYLPPGHWPDFGTAEQVLQVKSVLAFAQQELALR